MRSRFAWVLHATRQASAGTERNDGDCKENLGARSEQNGREERQGSNDSKATSWSCHEPELRGHGSDDGSAGGEETAGPHPEKKPRCL